MPDFFDANEFFPDDNLLFVKNLKNKKKRLFS